mmetsp:Transcript_35969/g.94334  ORF Transcript_35969/g.94334 Transcript_35969/m.94334 type:complete len:294 (+) Transcript_35969:675-1556(+)
MRTDRRSDNVVCRVDVGDPVPHRLVDGVLQRLRSCVHGDALGAQHLHPKDVEGLSPHVLGPHVHDALEPKQCARSGGGDAVLPGPGFSNDPFLPKLLCEQCLPQRVVDLVCSGVREIFTFQPDLCPTKLGRQPLAVEDRCRATHIVFAKPRELCDVLWVIAARLVLCPQLFVRRHKRLRNVPAAEFPEGILVLGLIKARGIGFELLGLLLGSRRKHSATDEGRNEVANLARRGVRQRAVACRLGSGDKGRPHHHAIGILSNLHHMLSFRNSKANHEWQVGVLANSCQKVWERR